MNTSASALTGIAFPEQMIDRETFRTCMRQVPGAVSIITTLHGDLRGGLTATAVCSVSAEPPQLLACVNRSASAQPLIAASGRFGVSFLSHEQQGVAAAFAASLSERFQVGDWMVLGSGIPLLRNAAAAFDCVVVQTLDAGTHTIFIGAIVAAVSQETRNLVYKSGIYGSI